MSQGVGKRVIWKHGKIWRESKTEKSRGSRGGSQRIPFIHYLRKYLLSIYHVPGRTLDTKGRVSGTETSLP